MTPKDELLSCMIGLACACSNNPPTENTDGLLMAGLHALRPDAAMTPEQLRRLTERVKADKHAVSPNCATCTSRCGRTDDYDMARWHAAPEAVRAEKEAILSGIITLSRQGMQPFIYQALQALCEDWGPDTLHWYAEEARRLLPNESQI